MAYPNHALLAIQGLWNPSDMSGEVWQVGIRLFTGNPSNNWLADPQTYVDAVAPNIATWWSAGTGPFDSRAKISTIKCNNIKPDGHYKDTVTHQHPFTTPPSGGSAGIFPVFCTLAGTWETGHTTGRARRGRCYFPTNTNLGSSQGVTVSATARDQLRDKLKALLTILLINEPTGGLLVRPCIVSRVDGSINDINGVSVNDVYDVQRRRKNRIRGTRSAIAAFP